MLKSTVNPHFTADIEKIFPGGGASCHLFYPVSDCNLYVSGPLYSQDRILQAMGNVTLAFHLLCERANPSSFWQPYIRSLPQEYDTPLFYQQDEVQVLLGTQAVQDVLSQYKNTARQYAYFYKLLQVGRFTEHRHIHTVHIQYQ